MTAALPDDQPLFGPDMVGLTAESWEDLDDDQPPGPRRCAGSGCGRPLRSRASIEAGIGPCCAAKIGRAVIAGRRIPHHERGTMIASTTATDAATDAASVQPGDPIDVLELTARPHNTLTRAGITTIGALTDCTETDITDLRNAGKQTLREIQTRLAEHGLALRGTEAGQRS